MLFIYNTFFVILVMVGYSYLCCSIYILDVFFYAQSLIFMIIIFIWSHFLPVLNFKIWNTTCELFSFLFLYLFFYYFFFYLLFTQMFLSCTCTFLGYRPCGLYVIYFACILTEQSDFHDIKFYYKAL